MRRWVKRVAVVGMLLLSSAIAVVWVRSYFITENLGRLQLSATGSVIRFRSVEVNWGAVVLIEHHNAAGRLAQIARDTSFFHFARWPAERTYPYVTPGRSGYEYFRWAGFQLIDAPGLALASPDSVKVSMTKTTVLIIPLWFLLLVTGTVPAIVGVRYVRRRRRQRARETERTRLADRGDGGARMQSGGPRQLHFVRHRGIYALALFAVVASGLGSRRFGGYLPSFLSQYAGDTLWALMVFLLLGIGMPGRSTVGISIIALIACYLVEISQLYHMPWIDALRHTTLGGLMLGFGFLWSDLICYTVGVLMGAVVEWALQHASCRGGEQVSLR